MAKSKIKKEDYHFGFQTIFRLAIFSLVVYFLVVFLSSSSASPIPAILGDTINLPTSDLNQIGHKLYQTLPQSSRQEIEKLPSNPVIINLQHKLDQLKVQSEGFPQKQITEIKKQLLKNIYQDLINNLDSKNE